MGLRDRRGGKVIPFAQKDSSRLVPLPAPFLGWNSKDALAEMEPQYAVSMQDWWPLPTSVMLRKGYSRFATGSGQWETLMSYSTPTSSKFFGIVNGGSVYDITAGGAVGAASLTGLSNGRWTYVNNTTGAGNFLQMVNGTDKMRTWTGTAWHTDGDGFADVTGFDTATATGIWLFKTRIFFTTNGSLNAYYLAQNSIGGAASALNMQSIAPRGGYMVTMGTWTLDAGYGVDDYAVFVTSKGDIMVWQLSDPTSPSGIKLIGVWQLGSPLGKRCLYKWGGDMLYLSQDGVVPLSSALMSTRLNPAAALSDKIQPTISNAASLYSGNYGWQMIYYPAMNQLYLNVPVSTGASQQQYVMNTITKAWANFTGYGANCFEVFNDALYFGGNGFVGKAWDTFADNGSQIQGNTLQAFNSFGNEGRPKLFTMMRPILQSNGTPSVTGSINIDFDTSLSTASLSFTPTSYATWDSGTWDYSSWGGDLVTLKQWQGANGVGYWGAPQIVCRSSGIETHWTSTDVRFKPGAGI